MNLRDKKGSITIFVLVGLLFMSAFLIILYASNVNRSKIAKEQFNIISEIYSKGSDGESYTDAYTALRKENKQTMTSYSENSSTLELTKTFEEKMSNYRIYGNSVQDGTPTPSTPVEIQSVGEKTKNLLPFPYTGVSQETSEAKLIINQDGGIMSSGIPTAYIGLSLYKGELIKSSTNSITIALQGDCVNTNILTTVYDVEGNTLMNFITKIGKPQTIDYSLYPAATSMNITYRRESNGVEMSGTGYFMVSEGTDSNEYEPYGKYKIPVKVSGINLYDFPQESTLTSIAGETKNYIPIGSQNKAYLEKNKQYIIKFDYEVLENTDVDYYVGNAVGTKANSIFYGAFTQLYNTIYQAGSAATKGTFEWIVTAKDDIDFEQYPYLTLGIMCGFKGYEQSASNNGSIKITNVLLCEYQENINYNINGKYIEPQIYNIYLDEPLRKIGDVEDYIDFKTGTVYRNIKEIIINGTETISLNSQNTTNNKLYLCLTESESKSETSLLQTHGTGDYPYGNSSTLNIAIGTNNRIFFVMPLGLCNTSAENTGADNRLIFIEWLKGQYTNGTPVKIYRLLEETDDIVTINLPELETFEDYTRIEVLTQIPPSKIEATYEGYTLE